MAYNHHLPKKIDLMPKKHHGWTFLIFLMGIFLPPIAVAARFGFGSDFALNCFLCICGYIPSHGHNFYIQNIRNNDNKKRTPKWAQKLGLVDDTEMKRKLAKSQWSKRYDERNPNSTLDDAELEEGEEGNNYIPSREIDPEEVARRRREGLWTNQDEEYYNEEHTAPNQSHWHYPANFEGTTADPPRRLGLKGGALDKKPRTNAASYAPSGTSYGNGHDNFSSRDTNDNNRWDSQHDDDVPEWGTEYGAPGKKKNKKGAMNDDYNYSNGGGYGGGNDKRNSVKIGGGRSAAEENWDHQF